MTNTIEIFVDTKGEATVTTKGFAGSACRDASKFIEQALGQRVSEIALLTKEVSFLRTLAKAFRRIVGRGGRYPVPNWKWICLRTADSLDRLADRLMEYRRIRRHEPSLLNVAPAVEVAASANRNSNGTSRATKLDKSSHHDDEENIFKLLGYE